MRILVALLVFSAIIFFHELGHFLLAKFNHVTVLEFSIGMGPRLLSFEWGGTRYSLKILPFGGSCMMMGEDNADMEEGSLGSKSVWARISVIAAGPIFNFILAYLLSLFIIGTIGYDTPTLLKVTKGMPAESAGLQVGDQILKMNGKTIHFYREVADYLKFHAGETVVFEYERDAERYETEVSPVLTENGYKFGVVGSVNYRERTSVIQTLTYSFYEVGYWIDVSVESLKMIFRGNVTLNDVSGPVGVVNIIGETYESSKSDGVLYIWLNMCNIAILLSANLGVMNLLPLPALDGGRLLILFIEVFRRKKMDPELEGRIHFYGLMALLLLMIVVLFNDARRIIF